MTKVFCFIYYFEIYCNNCIPKKYITTKDKQTLGKVADLMAREKQLRAAQQKEEVEQVDEKINLVKAKMGDVIKDFQKSDAPQFKGKSM